MKMDLKKYTNMMSRGLGAMAFLGLCLVSPLRAQDAPSPTEPAASGDVSTTPAPAAKEVKDKTFGEVLKQGGPVMIFLGIASILMVGFTVEGLVKLRVTKLAPPALVARLKEAINGGNYQEAWQICQANRSFLGAVLGAGLERIGRSKDAVDFAVQETSLKEATALKTNTTYLSVIGVVSPMIGLTGTVTGMIRAFATLGASGIGDPSGLAAAIGEVLVATAGGLTVAIPAFIFFYILKAKAQNAVLSADSLVYRLLEDIPYDQVSGVRIGESFAEGSITPGSRTSVQKVSMALTTNCPACNFKIAPGTTPCPNCGSVLEWGA